MSNTARITSRRIFKSEDVAKIIQATLDNLGLTATIKIAEVTPDLIRLSSEKEGVYDIDFWMYKRKIEYSLSIRRFESWVCHSIENNIAVAYGGRLGDEGSTDRWEGIANKYPTFKSYLDVSTFDSADAAVELKRFDEIMSSTERESGIPDVCPKSPTGRHSLYLGGPGGKRDHRPDWEVCQTCGANGPLKRTL